MRLLLVEDDDNVREALLAVLTLESIPAVSFVRGRDFMDYVESGEPFDIAMIDVTLPDRSGWEVRDWLRDKGYPQPAIVCSGKAPPTDLPADTPYLQKPFPSVSLITLVRSLVGEA